MKKFIILGAGLSGRLAKYVLGDSVVLVGRVQEELRGFFYVHEYLDKQLTSEKILINKIIVGSEEVQYVHSNDIPLELLRKKYLRKTGQVGKACSSFSMEEITGWTLNEEALPCPGVKEMVQRVDLENGIIRTEGRDLDFHFLVNTIPLPNFLLLCHLPVPRFGFRFYRIGLRKNQDTALSQGICVLFYPGDLPEQYRTVVGNGMRICEYSEASLGGEFGARKFDRVIYPGKILPEPLSKQYLEILKNFRVTCLGRYACWEPRMMLHDVWELAHELKKELVG